MLLGETLNANDMELSERKRMVLGLDLRTLAMSDAVDNIKLRNEIQSLLTKACVDCGAASHNYKQK